MLVELCWIAYAALLPKQWLRHRLRLVLALERKHVEHPATRLMIRLVVRGKGGKCQCAS